MQEPSDKVIMDVEDTHDLRSRCMTSNHFGDGNLPKFAPMGQRPLCRVTPLGRAARERSAARLPDLSEMLTCFGRARAKPRAQRPGEPAGPTSVSSSFRPQNASPAASSPALDDCFAPVISARSPLLRNVSCRSCPQRIVTVIITCHFLIIAFLSLAPCPLVCSTQRITLDASSFLVAALQPWRVLRRERIARLLDGTCFLISFNAVLLAHISWRLLPSWFIRGLAHHRIVSHRPLA